MRPKVHVTTASGAPLRRSRPSTRKLFQARRNEAAETAPRRAGWPASRDRSRRDGFARSLRL